MDHLPASDALGQGLRRLQDLREPRHFGHTSRLYAYPELMASPFVLDGRHRLSSVEGECSLWPSCRLTNSSMNSVLRIPLALQMRAIQAIIVFSRPCRYSAVTCSETLLMLSLCICDTPRDLWPSTRIERRPRWN